jgi:hypothetical protein
VVQHLTKSAVDEIKIGLENAVQPQFKKSVHLQKQTKDMGKRKTLNLISYGFLAVGMLALFLWISKKPEEKGVVFTPEITKVQLSVKEINNILQYDIVAFGESLLGTPYVEAGCSKAGFDCSGFVYFVFKNFKIEVPRSSSGYANFGKEIPIDDVMKGDVLIFLSPTRNEIGHIGIVSIANGIESNFIHSSSGKEMRVIETNLTDSGYKERFVKAIRVLK